MTMNVEQIIADIQKKIEINKIEHENLLEFIASELANSSISDDEKIGKIVDNIKSKYYTKNEIKNQIETSIQKTQLTKFNEMMTGEYGSEFKNLIDRIEQNRDLQNPADKVLRFNKAHLNLLSKIFHMQITQNYLSALKWFITDDLVTKQSQFNYTIEETIKKLASIIDALKKDNQTKIIELQNFTRDSEHWIHTNEIKIDDLESKIQEIKSITSKYDDKLESITSQIRTLARISQISIDTFKIKTQHSDLLAIRGKVPGYLISKIYELESLQKKPVELPKIKLSYDDILYFLHIPKNSGTSFIDVIDNYFPNESICKGHDWEQLLPNLSQDISKFKLIRGHFGYGIYHSLPKKPIYITMLRDPIDRTISDYQQSILTPDMGAETSYFKESVLLDLVTSKDKKWRFTNNQTKHIVIDLDPSHLKNSTDKNEIDKFSRFLVPEFISPTIPDNKLLELAKKRLSKFAFVGITERFEESLFLLCYTFGWKPVRYIPKLNVSLNKKTKDNISLTTLEAIKDCTKLDSQLYQFALELFESRFSQMINNLKIHHYHPSMSELGFFDLIYAMLERNYENEYWKSKPAVSSINYDFGQALNGSGWYSREYDPDDNIFRWTGPSTVSTIDLPKIEGKNLGIHIGISNYMSEDIVNGLEININNIPISIKKTQKKISEKQILFEGKIPNEALETSRNLTQLSFKIPETINYQSINVDSDDKRYLGIALNKIIINSP